MDVAEVKEHSDEEEEYERDGDEEDDDDDCDAASSSSTTTIGISDHENEISGCVFRSITSFFVEGADEVGIIPPKIDDADNGLDEEEEENGMLISERLLLLSLLLLLLLYRDGISFFLVSSMFVL